ncbi:DUF362 domain-containing protein [candidate division KSB1 bacterium]|nr:DUF362 domain-containing protein [candidate division KSB1 bacterium]
MQPVVHFAPLSGNDDLLIIHAKIEALFDAADMASCIDPNDMVAIKTHFGEQGNTTHVPSSYMSPIVKRIKQAGGKPFLTDTNVLYKSVRSDSISHLALAHAHGFTMENCGAPVIIADGLRGDRETNVPISGELFNEVSIATDAVASHAMVVVSHVTGHLAAGMGAALKNLGMGLASRKGKMRQHSSVKPWISKSKCTGCGQCVEWCPENAIAMQDDIAEIQPAICIGCGECLTVCQFAAVQYNWQTSSADLQKSIAEHALGAVINKKNKVGFLNFVINITKDCDCMGFKQKPVIHDFGLLASKDPVAIDQASLDLISNADKRLRDLAYKHIDETIQLQHAEKIGLGSTRYELIEAL